jgi:hypothetical protein
MRYDLRWTLRPLLLLLLAGGLAACHFHGCGHGGRHWRTPIPIRHCR